jgi:hypothetical protein
MSGIKEINLISISKTLTIRKEETKEKRGQQLTIDGYISKSENSNQLQYLFSSKDNIYVLNLKYQT